MFGLSPISPVSGFSDLGSLFKSTAPITTYSAPYTVPVSKGNDMAINWGGAVQGGANGAITGTAASPGIGSLIGGAIGAFAGLFSPKSKETAGAVPASNGLTSGLGSLGNIMPTLTDALSLGLGSIGRTQPQNITQTQTVNQGTEINLNNIIGGREFGGTDLTTGDFDIFKTISDVFAIRDAQAAALPAAGAASVAGFTSSAPKSSALPLLILAGGGFGLIYLLTKKGK